MIGKLLVFGMLLGSTAGLECYLSRNPHTRFHFDWKKGYTFGGGIVGGERKTYHTDVTWNMKNQLNYNGELTTCDTPPETTLCAKQHSSVDGLVQRSQRSIYISIFKSIHFFIELVGIMEGKQDLILGVLLSTWAWGNK